MPWNDPMGDSSDPESSNYGGGWGGDMDNDPDNDSWSRAYTQMGKAAQAWQASRPDIDFRVSDLFGPSGVGKFLGRNIKNQMDWSKRAPYGAKSNSTRREGQLGEGHGDVSQGWLLNGGSGITGTNINGPKTGGSQSSSYDTYADPITGRLLYQSQAVNNLTNQGFSDQQLLDQLMGTGVSGQNLNQQIGELNSIINGLKKAGKDSSYYQRELARLTKLKDQQVSPDNPLLAYVNSGLNERVANEQLDNTNANQLRAMQEAQGRRGLGILASPMTDQLRASLGLSTAQARNQNKLNAQDQAFKNRTSLMSFLKQSQNQDYTQDMGRTGIGMTLGDWENQRKIADKTMKMQNKQYRDMLDQQEDSDMWGAIGDIAGGIDWGSFF